MPLFRIQMKMFCLKEYLHYNLVVMKILGLWPKKDYNSSKVYTLYAIIVNGFFGLTISVGLTGYVLTSRNLLEDVIGTGYYILGIMATAKSLFIMKYNKMFKILVDEEVHKSVNVSLNQNQYKILHDYLRLWKKVYFTYNYISVLMVINYITVPIFSKTPYDLPLNCWYPFDYKKPIVYEIVYVHQSIATFVDVFINIDGATLTSGFLAYLSAECEVLVNLLRNLNRDNLNGGTRLDTDILKMHIKYHKRIVKYSKLIESYFSKYLLIQFTSSCLSTALLMTSLTMKHESNFELWFLTVLQLGVWMDLFIYCWYGNEVTVKSKKIPYAAFESNWIYASRSFRKDLLTFIHRTQKPIKIFAVNFIELSLDTFIGILRMAYSYFMLLRQLSKED